MTHQFDPTHLLGYDVPVVTVEALGKVDSCPTGRGFATQVAGSQRVVVGYADRLTPSVFEARLLRSPNDSGVNAISTNLGRTLMPDYAGVAVQ